jgi:hypothetical protein
MAKKINLDSVFRNAQLGLINKSISQTMTGLRTTHKRINTPTAKDNHGYVFLTKPQLNLSMSNIMRYRPFMPLLNKNKASLGAWIRGTLDPRWARVGDRAVYLNKLVTESEETDYPAGEKDSYTLPLVNGTGRMDVPEDDHASQVDVYSPFINIITNNVVQISGFPDIDMPVFTGEPNRIGSSFQMIDGVENLNMPVDITMTIQDLIGDPVFNLFRTLSLYPGRIYGNQMMRYPDFILEDALDYNIRLYRLIIAADGETIHHIGSTMPAFIQGVAIGHHFDYSLDTPYREDNLVNVRLMGSGVIYDDPILIDDFNVTVMYANKRMRGNKDGMTLIPKELVPQFSYERVYPFIDPLSFKLQWWTESATYARVFKEINNFITETPTILV